MNTQTVVLLSPWFSSLTRNDSSSGNVNLQPTFLTCKSLCLPYLRQWRQRFSEEIAHSSDAPLKRVVVGRSIARPTPAISVDTSGDFADGKAEVAAWQCTSSVASVISPELTVLSTVPAHACPCQATRRAATSAKANPCCGTHRPNARTC